MAIAGGGSHTIALRTDGTVRTWGGNFYGQFGDGTTTDRTTPVSVRGLTGVVAVACGGSHTIALLSDGTARAWGLSSNGQLGEGVSTNFRASPVTVIGLTGAVAASGGSIHSIALTAAPPQ